MKSFILLLISYFLFPISNFLLAQNTVLDSLSGDQLCYQRRLQSDTTYHFPDGILSNDTAWINLAKNEFAPQFFTIYAKKDSGASSCTLRVEAYCGYLSDTLKYGGADSSMLCIDKPWSAIPTGMDGWAIIGKIPLCRRFGFLVTSSRRMKLTMSLHSGR